MRVHIHFIDCSYTTHRDEMFCAFSLAQPVIRPVSQTCAQIEEVCERKCTKFEGEKLLAMSDAINLPSLHCAINEERGNQLHFSLYLDKENEGNQTTVDLLADNLCFCLRIIYLSMLLQRDG